MLSKKMETDIDNKLTKDNMVLTRTMKSKWKTKTQILTRKEKDSSESLFTCHHYQPCNELEGSFLKLQTC